MSLINDALKKARLEAARQDAARRGLPLPPLAAATSPERPSRAPVAVLGAALALVLGAGLYWAGQRSAAPPAAARAVAEPAADRAPEAGGASRPEPGVGAVVPSAAPAAPPAVSREASAPPEPARERGPLASAQPSGGEGAAAPVTPQAPAPAEPRAPAERRQPSASAEPSAPEPPAAAIPAASAPAALPVYVREAVLPGGAGRLELGGIAWSEERPFALINGRVVGAGDRIERFLVVDIQPKRVELRGEGGAFYLQLK